MRRSRVIVMTAIALTALSACGSSSGGEAGAQVAALATPKASSSASSSAAAQQKPKTEAPRERLDTTPEEFQAMMAPFNKCLKKAGFKDQAQGKMASDRSKDTTKPASKKEETENAAYRACEEQYYPLPAWEKDPANPEARDFALAVVKCLKKKGVKYVEIADDGISPSFGGDQNDSRSISMGMDLAPECEREVAAAKK